MAWTSPYSTSPLGLRDETAEAPVELDPEEPVPTREKYGVDISDIRPSYLWAIAKRVHDGPIERAVRSLRSRA